MKTSYFSNIKNLEVPLSISQGPPKWYEGPEFKPLAPPWELVRKAHAGLSEADYEAEYRRLVLDHFDPRELYDAIIEEHGPNVVLLCFEKLATPGEYCHRRMVAKWFEENLKVEVPEWTKPAAKSTLTF